MKKYKSTFTKSILQVTKTVINRGLGRLIERTRIIVEDSLDESITIYQSVKIVEAEMCSYHVHMLVEIPPSMSVSSFIGSLKGKSTLMIFERHANLKYKFGNRHFW